MSVFLIRYDKASEALAAARSVDEVLEIRNQAEAMRAYARQASDGELIADAVEIKKRAERRLGELIRAQAETVGLNKGRLRRGVSETPRSENDLPTLDEIGIDKNLAKRARRAAAETEHEFEERVAFQRAEASASIVRTDRLINSGRRQKSRVQAYDKRTNAGGNVADLQSLIECGQKFGVIYADPRWHFETYSDKGRDRSPVYSTMTIDDICALPVRELAADDSRLFMWIPWPHIFSAPKVFEAGGFRYSGLAFDWVKLNPSRRGLHTGMGYNTRANPEPCLLAIRGSPARLNASVHSVVMNPISDHSAKPEEVRQRIEALAPGPYLELFARRPVKGWTVWGNEVPPPLSMHDTGGAPRTAISIAFNAAPRLDIGELGPAGAT